MPTVISNGIRIHYEERGSGDPLILIMGLGAPGSRWEDHAACYEKHFRCILVDNRGAGESDKPDGPFTTKMMADDTAGLMLALGIENARIAGISMGSAIAQELALSYPKMVRSLVLISSWSRCDRYTQIVFEHFKKMRALASPADFTQLLQLWIASAPYYQEHFDEMVRDQTAAQADYMPVHAFQAQSDACAAHNTFDRLDKITAPTLLTVGDADIFTPMRLTVEMHERMPGSQMVVFKGLGHIHHWEDLERFNDVTMQFLSEN
ncbi:MAG TPA: alpha/beta fold hydrolase [Anaerolineales bacterium]|nr:alpha/beta fold hydrolase [Anaerolineales bacterium]